jgi:hypothetical protein
MSRVEIWNMGPAPHVAALRQGMKPLSLSSAATF